MTHEPPGRVIHASTSKLGLRAALAPTAPVHNTQRAPSSARCRVLSRDGPAGASASRRCSTASSP
eukprot:scaffold207349_cov35-Tisochrysis_lutea.AAC.2